MFSASPVIRSPIRGGAPLLREIESPQEHDSQGEWAFSNLRSIRQLNRLRSGLLQDSITRKRLLKVIDREYDRYDGLRDPHPLHESFRS